MGVLKFLVWTACAVGLGIFLASWRYQGRTPVQHAQRLWREQVSPQRVDAWASSVEEAWEEAREAVSGEPKPPRERHSAEDRRALERLISQRGEKPPRE